MTESQFDLSAATDKRRPTVTAIGEIDLANVGEFQDMLAKAAAAAPAITVDLSGVSYCDSAAVRALFSVAAVTEMTLVVANRGPIKTLLGISGLDRVVKVEASDR
jgi:anti-sigma B factor antagonist